MAIAAAAVRVRVRVDARVSAVSLPLSLLRVFQRCSCAVVELCAGTAPFRSAPSVRVRSIHVCLHAHAHAHAHMSVIATIEADECVCVDDWCSEVACRHAAVRFGAAAATCTQRRVRMASRAGCHCVLCYWCCVCVRFRRMFLVLLFVARCRC